MAIAMPTNNNDNKTRSGEEGYRMRKGTRMRTGKMRSEGVFCLPNPRSLRHGATPDDSPHACVPVRSTRLSSHA
eukprot:1816047-Pyramimonas_sp.AAC.1